MSNIHSISDFTRGDEVFHKTESSQKMIVIGTDFQSGEVVCRYSRNGELIRIKLLAEELEKCSDMPPIIVKHPTTRNNKW